MSKIIGFTGTQFGMTTRQCDTIVSLLKEQKPIEAHHGDCIGADKDFHIIATYLGIKIIIHPPVISYKRAYCEGNVILPEKSYLVRNHDIVDSCDEMIACPKGYKEELRSGTWATVRYAMKVRKSITIVFPDGRIEKK